jgi:SAM-dependent methyltransferase
VTAVPALVETRCAICGTEGNALELYPANFVLGDLNAQTFSARRLPDGIRYRLVQCRTCGLVRSDPVIAADTMAALYRDSTLNYIEEIVNLRQTYGDVLDRLLDLGGKRDSLLEIGCGNGFMLEEALRRGYARVRGIEPSYAAAGAAAPTISELIIRDILRPGIFPESSFDVVCLFQTFDHIPDPGALLDECRRLLTPNGLFVALNHNVRAVSARLLRSKSPIVDIEHTYLYSPDTIARIVRDHGFQVLQVGPIRNQYSVHYLSRLLPLPEMAKERLLKKLGHTALGRATLSLPLGNLLIVARKLGE